MNSDISKRMRDFSLPNRKAERARATSVLPTPVGPRNRKLPAGRLLEWLASHRELVAQPLVVDDARGRAASGQQARREIGAAIAQSAEKQHVIVATGNDEVDALGFEDVEHSSLECIARGQRLRNRENRVEVEQRGLVVDARCGDDLHVVPPPCERRQDVLADLGACGQDEQTHAGRYGRSGARAHAISRTWRTPCYATAAALVLRTPPWA